MMNELSQAEILRYSRHLIIPEVGLEGQKKLKATSVLIVGAGGLGSPVALYLASAGIGKIGLVDDDVVDVSNLQRQILHDTLHEGQPKVNSGRDRLLAINPSIQVEAILDCFNAESSEKIAEGYDILVDCSDNFSTRYLINDLCVLTKRPDVYGAIYRFEGQVSVFDARFGPCYRCVFPDPPPPELSPGCSDTGVFGVLPGVIGTLQAAEVIKLALNIGHPLFGKIMIYDALDASFQTVQIPRSPRCQVCGPGATITGPEESGHFCADGVTPLSHAEMISAVELKKRLCGANPPVLVDVRNLVEQQISRIPGAIHAQFDQILEKLQDIDHDREIVVFCRNGRRSARAVSLLRSQGFSHVQNLVGGINAWVEDIDTGQYKY